jgi:hypothetical protein
MRNFLDIVNPMLSLLLEDDSDDRRFWREIGPHFRSGSEKSDWSPDITSWPPTPSEMAVIERQVLQNPEWVARWAYFGWSWNEAKNYHFDRHNQYFNFFDVPEICYMHDKVTPDRGILRIGVDGTIIPINSEYSHHYVFLPSAIANCKRVVAKAQAWLPYLTGNYYIRFGRWRDHEQSRNGLTGELEKGVSAYHASFDMEERRWAVDASVNEDTISGTMGSFFSRPDQKVFLVQGTELRSTGSDGEPLLKNVKLIKTLTMDDVFCPGIFDPREDY